MELTLGSWFTEPKFFFKFSHKVDLFIRDQIKKTIMEPLGLLAIEKDKFINLTITTRSNQDKLEVKLDSKKTDADHMNYELWFPYSKIVNSRYPLKGYLDNFIDSLPVIFEEFGVTDTLISKIRSECEKEILNNKEYELMPVKKENSQRKEISIEEFKRQLGVK